MIPVIKSRIVSLVILCCLALTVSSFAQNSENKTGHIKFDISKNQKVEFASATSGYIDLFVKRTNKKSGKPTFFIRGESFVSVNQEEFKSKDSVAFLTIDELIEAWEKSDSVIRTNVFKKIYLYEILENGSTIRHEVVWEEAEY